MIAEVSDGIGDRAGAALRTGVPDPICTGNAVGDAVGDIEVVGLSTVIGDWDGVPDVAHAARSPMTRIIDPLSATRIFVPPCR